MLPTAASVVLVAAWKLFDVFVIGTLQAFIFFLLTIIYFGQAREGLDEHAAEVRAAPTRSPAASH